MVLKSRLRPSFAALLLAVGILAVSGSVPAHVDAVGRVPGCRLEDFYTVPRDYDSWSTTFVDWLLRVERNYRPPDLVAVSDAGIPGGGFLRAVTIKDTRAMGRAAAAAGAPIGIWSPYRPYREQVQIFNDYVSFDGFEDAITYSMRPGHSEHQLGLGVDFMSAGGSSPLPGDWGQTPAGAWMRENAWKYGWVNSYPLGDNGELFNERTCFHYEPWHYRYLGREMARKIHRSGLTIREYMWMHYVMVDPRTGEPIATPTPWPTSSPSPIPTSTATSVASASSPSSPTPAPPASPASSGGGPLGIDPLVWGIGVATLVLVSIVSVTRRRASAP